MLESKGFHRKHVKGLYSLDHYERADGAFIQIGRNGYAARTADGKLYMSLTWQQVCTLFCW